MHDLAPPKVPTSISIVPMNAPSGCVVTSTRSVNVSLVSDIFVSFELAGSSAVRTTGSRSTVVIVTTLTLVPLIIALAEGVSIGGSVAGKVIYVVVSVTLSGIWLGIILWGIAVIWYRRSAP